MTAIEVFKQSLAFYTRLFNKLFWLSVASSIAPLIMLSVTGDEQTSGVAMIMIMLMSMFFSVYMMCLIHQFSQDQDDSLQAAFSLTLKKLIPVTTTSFALGLLVMLAVIPAVMVATVLSSGIENEQLKNVFIGIIIAIPVGVIMYRCFFAAYFTLADGLNPIESLKASNQQVKGNKLIFRGFMLLSVVTAVYMLALILLNLLFADNPMALATLEFSLSVIAMPFFSVFIYRLFVVSKAKPSIDEEV